MFGQGCLSGGKFESLGEAGEIDAGELPLKRDGDLLVAAAQREQLLFERVDIGEVVGGQNLALKYRELDLGPVEPAGVDTGVWTGRRFS